MFGKRKIFTSRINAMTTIAFGLALLFAVFAMPSSAQAAGKPVYCERYHTVQQGENIASIAAYYSVDYYDIGMDSGLKYPFYLTVGQRLCINGATLPVAQLPVSQAPVSQSPPATQAPVPHVPVSQSPPATQAPVPHVPVSQSPPATQAPPSSHQSPAQVASPAPSAPRPHQQASYSCTYVVKSGDMLSRIARYHGTSMRALARANGLYNVNKIYVGQHLVVPCK